MLRDHVISSLLLAILLSDELKLGDTHSNVSSSHPSLSELKTFRASDTRNNIPEANDLRIDRLFMPPPTIDVVQPIIQPRTSERHTGIHIIIHLVRISENLVLGLLLLTLLGGGGSGLNGLDGRVLVLGSDLDGGLWLGLDEGNGIREVLGGTLLSQGVVGLHDLDLDTQDTLTEEDVSDGVVDVVAGGLTRVDHETVGELHRLGTGGTQFTGNDNLATLGAGLHDESEDTVTGSDY